MISMKPPLRTRMDLFICKKLFVYILWITNVFVLISGAANQKVPIERNALACEGGTMPLRCPANMRIHIKWANYGRYSLSVCNQHRVTGKWSTRCMSVRSLSIVSERCHDRQSCVLQVQNNVFGDPCPDTVKYLEVRYSCKPGGTPIKTPADLVTNTSAEEPTTAAPVTPPTTTTTTRRSTTPRPATTRRPTRPASVVVTGSPAVKCEARVEREINWPETRPGYVVRSCPNGMTGQARWQCGLDGWIGSPDLSLCQSKVSVNLKELNEEGEKSEIVAKELEEVTKTQPMYGGDLVAMTKVMHDVVKNLKEDLKDTTPTEKLEIANDVNSALVKSTSNILSEKQSSSWKDLPKTKQTKVATTLVDSIEESGFELAETMDKSTKVTCSSENVLMKVERVDSRSVTQDMVFPEEVDHELPTPESKLMEDKITLPASALQAEAQMTGRVTVVFTVYDNIAKYMKTNETKNSTNTTVIVNSNIISASINSGASIKLREPVLFTMKHTTTENVMNPVCVFWDYIEKNMVGEWSPQGCSLRSSNVTHTECQCDHLTNFAVLMDVVGTKLDPGHEMSLQIITYAGCVVSIVCLFLAFLTFQCFRNLQSDRNTIHKNLCLSLLLAEVIFLAGIMQYRHVILCSVIAGVLHFLFLASFAWMCLEGVQLYVMLIEVFEAERSRVKWYYLSGYGLPAVVVAIAAGVHHEGYGTERHCWLRTDTYFIWAFVGPVAAVITVNIVMLSIAIYMMCRHAKMASSLKSKEKSRLQNVNSSKKCLVQQSNESINKQELPFTVGSSSHATSSGGTDSKRVSVQMSNNSINVKETPKRLASDACERSLSVSEEDTRIKKRLTKTAAWIKGAVILVVLLGLTWSFGLLYISEDSVVMAYIFTILNTLQGLFIFVFHCIMNDKVQKEYKKCVRRTSWMPECIRVAYGGQPVGYNPGSSGNTPSRSNSTAGNYLTRFLSGRRRKKSSTTSLPKSNTPENGKCDVVIKNPQADDFSSVFHETDGSEKCHRVHPQDNAVRNGDILGDLSFIDASIVDTDFVSEYCQNNMMVANDGINTYNKTKIPLNVKNRFSGFSDPGEITESEYSDTELFKMTDYDSKPRNFIDRKPSTIKEELEQDGYEVPSHLRTPSQRNLVENQAPAEKNIVDKVLGPLGLLHKKHPPSCQNLSSITEDSILDDSTLYKSTPNLQYNPPAAPPKEPEKNKRDSFGQSMPNLAYINDAYEHDSMVPSDAQRLLDRNSMLRRSDSDPGRNLNWPKRASNCSDC
ncbi:adhesion G protein-coupled receptor L2-like isoform X4 [Lineus longissimus]|uniref:adhesion G protein-coupled receptor L2-like isoform X4 n=1 Tax=Lineus longissimus TaxID=88925 RepID=UPI00315CF4FE